MAFGDWLHEQRVRAGLKQAALEEAIGKKKSYVAKLESGAIPPPDRQTCRLIGEALGLDDPDEVWRRAAPDRLRHLDPDLSRWHDDIVNGGSEDATIAQLLYLVPDIGHQVYDFVSDRESIREYEERLARAAVLRRGLALLLEKEPDNEEAQRAFGDQMGAWGDLESVLEDARERLQQRRERIKEAFRGAGVPDERFEAVLARVYERQTGDGLPDPPEGFVMSNGFRWVGGTNRQKP